MTLAEKIPQAQRHVDTGRIIIEGSGSLLPAMDGCSQLTFSNAWVTHFPADRSGMPVKKYHFARYRTAMSKDATKYRN
jgi:hypothetical protein